VAYIPLFEANNPQQSFNDSIIAVDLDNGNFLKKIKIGDGVGAVFINAYGDKLYASAEDAYRIVLIDTKSLVVDKVWNNLAIKPQQIILNNTESKLYFAQRNKDEIYQIDLNTDQISIALTQIGFEKFWYSENLETIVFKTHDFISDTYQINTYDLNHLTLKYQKYFANNPTLFVSNDGEKYYIPIFSVAKLFSLNFNNEDINWSFFYNIMPVAIGFLTDHFSNVYELPNDKLLVVGWFASYELDARTGIGVKTSDLRNFYQPYNKIEDKIFLKSNSPEIPQCADPIPPGDDCTNYLPLELSIQNHQTGEETVIYRRERSGSLAKGRYIGPKFYIIPKIPVLHQPLAFTLLLLMILLFAYKSKRLHDKKIY
jgi:hypothetical protein